MLQIVGALSNKLLDTTQDYMARVLGLHVGPQVHATYRHSLAFTLETSQTPTGANDYFLAIRNQSDTQDLIITHIAIDAGSAEIVQVVSVTGTFGGSLTPITPLNRVVGGPTALNADIQASSDITGLTDAGTFDRMRIAASGRSTLDLLERPIILPRNQAAPAIALLAETGSIALNVQVDIMVRTFDPPGI